MADFEDFTKKMRSSTKNFKLPEYIPDVVSLDLKVLRKINGLNLLPFKYTGSAWLIPSTKVLIGQIESAVGRCLGGGVFSSRDLDWLDSGGEGLPPGQFIPQKKLIGFSSKTQSKSAHEWVAFEYALGLITSQANYINNWDAIESIESVGKLGRDIQIVIKGKFAGGKLSQIYGQANTPGMSNLLDIAKSVGITTKNSPK